MLLRLRDEIAGELQLHDRGDAQPASGVPSVPEAFVHCLPGTDLFMMATQCSHAHYASRFAVTKISVRWGLQYPQSFWRAVVLASATVTGHDVLC